jgi:hypothetical protein
VGKVRQLLAVIGLSLGLVAALVSMPVPVQAAPFPSGGNTGSCTGDLASFLGLKSWDACLQRDANNVPQFKDLSDLWRIAIVLIEDLIKIAGYLAAGYLIWGGFKYIKSQGEPGEITQSRTIITNSIIGLVIVLIAVAIVQFIAGTFT